VHIDFYTARKLRRLFAPIEVTVEKFGCPPVPALDSVAGFFLVAKGQAFATKRHKKHKIENMDKRASQRMSAPTRNSGGTAPIKLYRKNHINPRALAII
jgi:hypothetical protein